MLGRARFLGISAAGWALNLALALAIALVMVLFVLEPVRVEGNSMMPRLNNDERLFVNRFVFNLEPIQRGDVIVFHYPRDLRESFIKRVIGLPGDRVRIAGGDVYINGHRLFEPYVPSAFMDFGTYPEVTVPQNDYYVLGDHRNSSNDSRAWGCLNRQYVFGKAVFAYWPAQDFGLVH